MGEYHETDQAHVWLNYYYCVNYYYCNGNLMKIMEMIKVNYPAAFSKEYFFV